MNTTETKETVSFTNEKIVDISRSENEVIRIARTQYKGTRYIDIRIFFEEKKSGEFRPTKKGISMKEDRFESFVDALKAVDLTTV